MKYTVDELVDIIKLLSYTNNVTLESLVKEHRKNKLPALLKDHKPCINSLPALLSKNNVR